jgi:hypothetical protein
MLHTTAVDPIMQYAQQDELYHLWHKSQKRSPFTVFLRWARLSTAAQQNLRLQQSTVAVPCQVVSLSRLRKRVLLQRYLDIPNS